MATATKSAKRTMIVDIRVDNLKPQSHKIEGTASFHAAYLKGVEALALTLGYSVQWVEPNETLLLVRNGVYSHAAWLCVSYLE